MQRGNHYLKSPQTETWPASIISVGIEYKEQVKRGEQEIDFSDVESYCLISHCIGEDGEVGKSAVKCGSKETLWGTIEDILPGNRRSFVVLDQLYTAFVRTGLEQMLDEDKVWLVNLSTGEVGKRNGKNWRDFAGFYITSDPPTVFCIQFASSRKVAVLVDRANFDLPAPNASLSSQAKCLHISGSMLSYIDCIKSASVGTIRTTIASQSFHGWRKSYMHVPVLVHGESEVTELERRCLYSGRNECYRMGTVYGPIHHLDYTSMYPALAMEHRSPTRLVSYKDHDAHGICDLVDRGYLCAANVVVSSRMNCTPMRQDGLTLFPTGKYSTSLCGDELVYALVFAGAKPMGKVAVYETDDIFSEWSKSLLELRDSAKSHGDSVSAAIYKRLANSLFGKFAQRSYSWHNHHETCPPAPWCQWVGNRPTDGKLCRWRSVGWLASYEQKPEEHRQSCPIITAALYGSARVKLWRAMKIAGGDNIIYTDTDSLWVNGAGMSSLKRCGEVQEGMPGRLSLKETVPWMRLYGLKHYETPTRRVHAGVPEGAKHISGWTWEYDVADNVGSACANDEGPRVRRVNRTFHHSGLYRHGVVSEDGRVSPINLEQ